MAGKRPLKEAGISSLELIVFEINCAVTDMIGGMTSDMEEIYLVSLFSNFENCRLFMLDLLQNSVFCTHANERGLISTEGIGISTRRFNLIGGSGTLLVPGICSTFIPTITLKIQKYSILQALIKNQQLRVTI
jgi:hypothetical protein